MIVGQTDDLGRMVHGARGMVHSRNEKKLGRHTIMHLITITVRHCLSCRGRPCGAFWSKVVRCILLMEGGANWL